MEQIQDLSQPPAEHPKMSLNFVWSELTPIEKAWILQSTGNQEAAQMILEENKIPAHVIKEQAGMQKTQIKVEGDITEALIKEEGNERNRVGSQQN